MKNVVFLALDERPCNYEFPYKIFNSSDFLIIRPPINIMGYKKTPADFEVIKHWILEATKAADGLVVSIDTLLYGGIIPSRLHYLSNEELLKRFELLREIKRINSKIVIYAFHLIMRCPKYNSNDEEPDYYQYHGRDIFRLGYLTHLQDLKMIKEEEAEELKQITIPKQFLDDFLGRRKINAELNCQCLNYLEENIIDFLTIPQDDSSEYGYTAVDQVKIREIIRKKNLMNKVYLYPGADEAGCTLMSRMFCHFNNLTPKIYLVYPSITSPTVIPSLEDRYIDTMIKYQIITAGAVIVNSLEECDLVFLVNAAAHTMLSSFYRKAIAPRQMTVLRNVVDSIELIYYAKHTLNKDVFIGDITYGNGSDIEIYELLAAKGMLFSIAGFAGWNTAANSIGCTIAQAICYYKNKETKQHLDFLVSRYIEDIGYCGYTRQKIMKDLVNHPKYNYFNAGSVDGEISQMIKAEVTKFIKENMNELYCSSKINSLTLPWKRLYEIHLEAEFVRKK